MPVRVRPLPSADRAGLLIAHEEIGAGAFEGAYKVIWPRQIPFISYPYEWCFSQLKDAALATLADPKDGLARHEP